MSAKKTLLFFITTCLIPLITLGAEDSDPLPGTLSNTPTLAQDAVAQQLGWTQNDANYCGGYYLEQPIVYPVDVEKNSAVTVTGEQGLLSQRGTSTLEGKVSITRLGSQITANKAFLYRDPATGKLSAVRLVGNVHLREPNTLVIAREGEYTFASQAKSLNNIIYRTAIVDRRIVGSGGVDEEEMQHVRKVTALTAWGEASKFSQIEPQVYRLTGASYSTCPPTDPAWRVKASRIVLNKETGRGYATHARILVKEVPVFYIPYINFPIDNRRKTGFLWPTYGTSGLSGPTVFLPFYWNMAPNYDMTITPALMLKRGVQLSDNFRYLTPVNKGNINFSILPHDRNFARQQNAAPGNIKEYVKIANNNSSIAEAELNRLMRSSTTRKSFIWRDDAQFNEHWSSHIDFNYVGDDYYLRDFGSLNEVLQNQLLQQADINYKSENWNFMGRMQAYQTLHPADAPPVQNAYRRFPQLILNADYPDRAYGLNYFINNEATHFEFLKTPGSAIIPPIGNRFHTQPGVSLPLSWPYFYATPRFQMALTNYSLNQLATTQTPSNLNRSLPIFDIAAGSAFSRDTSFFNRSYQQTLEPQVYYTYIPYRNQASIPIFDTTVNTLNYDQIFNYNRFSGIDRIGDANQIGLGITTRLIDQDSGFEKVRLGVGEIIYFADREVTLCNNVNSSICTDTPNNPENQRRLSPISGVLDYHVNNSWKFTTNVLWNPITKLVDNSTLGFHYQPDPSRILNLGYSFVRKGDPFSGIITNNSQNNLKLTDISFAWPLVREVSGVGRWSQDWQSGHFQNLLYGLQYDTCCWAVQLVGGRTFTNLENNNRPQYNNQFYVQFALKGLGNIGSGNPSGLLNTITGYDANTQFG